MCIYICLSIKYKDVYTYIHIHIYMYSYIHKGTCVFTHTYKNMCMHIDSSSLQNATAQEHSLGPDWSPHFWVHWALGGSESWRRQRRAACHFVVGSPAGICLRVCYFSRVCGVSKV